MEHTASPSENDGIEAFCKLSIDQLRWMASKAILYRGLHYFADERVRHIEWNDTQQHFLADVAGSALYTAQLWLEDGHLQQACNCPAHANYAVCKHTVASTAGVFYLLQDTCIGPRPSDEYLEELKQSFTAHLKNSGQSQKVPTLNLSPSSKNPKTHRPKAELRLVTHQHDVPSLEIHGTLPGEFFRACGTFPNDYHRRYPSLSLDYSDPLEDLLEIVEQANAFGIPVIYRGESRQRIRVQPKHTAYASRLVFDYDGKHHITISVYLLDDDGTCLTPVTRIDEVTFLLNDGTFGEATANPATHILQTVSRQHIVSNHPENVFALDRATFNAKAITTPFPEKCFLSKHTSFQLNTIERPSPINQKPFPRAQLALKITSEDAYNCVGRWVLHCGEHELPLDALDQHFSQFMGAENIHPRLMHAKTRIKVLTQAALQLYLLESDEQDAFIQDTGADVSFEQLQLKHKAVSFLTSFKKNWVALNAAQRKRLVVIPGSAQPWQVVDIPIDAIAHLYLCTFMPETREELGTLGSRFRLPKIDLASFVERVGLAANIWKIPLFLDNKPIDKAATRIVVNFTEHADIDWFELKAEVRCGKLAIPQEQWEQLIRGNLLLEKDGKAVLVQVSSKEAIQRLQALLKPRQSKKTKKSAADTVVESVPKLKILDWIALRKMGIEVNLPKSIEAIFDSLRHFKGIPARALPQHLNATLRDYQKTGYEWLCFLYEHRFGACLADDMGLGKTLQAITFLAAIQEGRLAEHSADPAKRNGQLPHLIVVPPSLLFNWQHELQRFYPALKIREYTSQVRNLEDALRADVVLTTYDMVRRDIKYLEKERFNVVIFDETQILKNILANRTRAALRLKRRFTLCLTGTPLENHVGEYYSIMNLALPGLLGEYKRFRSAFNQGDVTALERTRPFILRRTKAHILQDLPAKQEQDIYLEMSDSQKEIYTRTVGEVRDEILAAYKDKTKAQAGILALTALTRLRQVCVGTELLGQQGAAIAPKFQYLLTSLEELQEEGHCALVFSQYTRALDQLERVAQQAHLNYLRMDGKTPVAQRKKLVASFQNDPQTSFFFISLKTGGVGLNLTRANYVFHLDPWWNPAVENQASDRAHRIGQQQTVFIQRILMRQTIEEKMMELKRRKQALFDQIVDPAQLKEKQRSAITPEDIKFLLG